MVIEAVFEWPSVRARHSDAPLLREREQFLQHLLQQGTSRSSVRNTAELLLRNIEFLDLKEMRPVGRHEIEAACLQWNKRAASRLDLEARMDTARPFTRAAVKWFRFHGLLISPPNRQQPFGSLLVSFVEEMTEVRGLASTTLRTYGARIAAFLEWVGERHDSLASVTLGDVDVFLDLKRAQGMKSNSVATNCQALRTFFRYAESIGRCRTGIARGIRSPAIPKFDGKPKGLPWTKVRRLIRSASGDNASDIRARAILLLCAVYGLRANEVARLRLSDFDWQNETLTVVRSKRGKSQHYPIQYEAGEAILAYLRKGRPHCSSRSLFVTVSPPFRQLAATALWPIVAKRIRRLGFECEHIGPHSLRHSCATELLRTGSSVQEIADFLGHRSTKCVSLYARYDKRLLRSVADFNLSRVL
jgi:integrase/recombinase XerD